MGGLFVVSPLDFNQNTHSYGRRQKQDAECNTKLYIYTLHIILNHDNLAEDIGKNLNFAAHLLKTDCDDEFLAAGLCAQLL